MTESDFIFEELCGVRADGTRSTILVRVGKPTKDARCDDPGANTYQCMIHCGGPEVKPCLVYGEGPMQALHHGLKIIRALLELNEAGGLRFIWPDTGESNDWRQFWFGEGNPLHDNSALQRTCP